MNISDPIADMLTRIRNAGRVSHPELSMPASRLKATLAELLKREGYIKDFRVEDLENNKKNLIITLKYLDDKHVISGIKRISCPSCRVYVGVADIPRVLGGLGISVLSTPNGLITGKQAKKKNVGGEVVCYCW